MGKVLPPVVAIDGPTASGKGTIASLLAQELGYHYLDSGAIYRLLALDTLQEKLEPASDESIELIAERARTLDVVFDGANIVLNGQEVAEKIRTEVCGNRASELASIPIIRELLLSRQRDFRKAPGLVADGRDMGSVVFPDAVLKIFLTASAEVRAKRRYDQILKRGQVADYDAIFSDLQARDARDSSRSVAPLKPCEGARILDCSDMSIHDVVQTAQTWYQQLQA